MPQLIAADLKEPVWYTEGESNAEAVAALGLVATTNPEGAGKWSDDLLKWFIGKEVVFLTEDNNEAGRKHVRKVAAALRGVVPIISVVRFRDMPEDKDIGDWLAQGHTKAELLERARTAKPAPKDRLVTLRVVDAKTRRVEWLWPERFALGEINVIAGLPDYGKGLITCFIAAAATASRALPCGEGKVPQCDVLWFSAEDNLETTIKPRLIAAGADLNRIHFVQSTEKDEKDAVFNLMTDLVILRDYLEEHPEVRLVIIDPASAYVGVGKVDSRQATDVRGMLTPLQKLAEVMKVAVLLIAHFNKKTDVTSALLRVSDSIAYVAAPRSVYVVLDDPEEKGCRLLAKGKNNLARSDIPALRYSVSLKVVDRDDKGDIMAPFVVWETHVEISANDALAAAGGHSVKREAKAFLQERLADGSAKAEDLIEEAKMDGISKRTLDRAKKDLGIKSRKEPGKFDGEWAWELPPKKPKVA